MSEKTVMRSRQDRVRQRVEGTEERKRTKLSQGSEPNEGSKNDENVSQQVLSILRPEKVRNDTKQVQLYKEMDQELTANIQYKQVYDIAIMVRDFLRLKVRKTMYRCDMIEEIFNNQRSQMAKTNIEILVDLLPSQYPSHFSSKFSVTGKTLMSLSSYDMKILDEDIATRSL
jgi:hypothetical protein